MRKLILALTMAATVVPVAPALALQHYGGRHSNSSDWRSYRNYDYNRSDPRYGNYYADRYYRTGNYRERRLTRRDRIYRGSNGRYYCARYGTYDSPFWRPQN